MPYLAATDRLSYWQSLAVVLIRILLCNRKSHMIFDWYQIIDLGWPWTTLNGKNAIWCRKDASFAAHCTNLNEDRPTHAATKMQANDSSFWKYKAYADIAGVPLGLKWEWGGWWWQFLAIWVATSSETSEIRPAILYDDMLPLVGLRLIATWTT